MKLITYILTHKKIEHDIDSYCVPLLVGAESQKNTNGYQVDNTGDNISRLNKYYAELTGEYWAWKNSNTDIIGFFHYRRFLVKDLFLNKLKKEDIESYLIGNDIILPKKYKTHRSLYNHLDKTEKKSKIGPKIKEYDKLRSVIKEGFPEYLDTYDDILNGNETYWCNMFICNKKIADDYFKWLFEILKKMETKINFEEYPDNNQRLLGYFSETLLYVYIKKHQLKIKETYLYLTDKKFPKLNFLITRIPIISNILLYIHNKFLL
ncbi:DUF4422 domain-containing protein [Methanobrevibacter sp. DSM 116169]|uniref:DUF4422 domain-containing protein n=1 Tax=Methanobrevibacter sp. DSM 116169 TaxID=3242727 RepID=UPI0038FC5A3D